jgi:hypothetical protein
MTQDKPRALQGSFTGDIFLPHLLTRKTLISKDTVDAYMWQYNEWGGIALEAKLHGRRLMTSRSGRKRNFTLQLSVVLDYPVDLDLESLEENVCQRSLTAVAQEDTCAHCPVSGARGFLLFVFEIDIVPDAGSSRSHWHSSIGCPLTRGADGVHYVDNIHRCHRRALDVISHVQAIGCACQPGFQGGITNRGRT